MSTTSPLILIDSPSLLCGGLPLPSHCFQPFFLHTSARLCDRKEESKLAEDSERAKPNPGKTFGKLKLRLRSEEDAAALLAGLKSKERLLLLSALQAKVLRRPFQLLLGPLLPKTWKERERMVANYRFANG